MGITDEDKQKGRHLGGGAPYIYIYISIYLSIYLYIYIYYAQTHKYKYIGYLLIYMVFHVWKSRSVQFEGKSLFLSPGQAIVVCEVFWADVLVKGVFSKCFFAVYVPFLLICILEHVILPGP